MGDDAGDAVGKGGKEDFSEVGEFEGVGFEVAAEVRFTGEFAKAVRGADGGVKDAVRANALVKFSGDFVAESEDSDGGRGVRVVDLSEGSDEGEGFARACAGGDEGMLA